MSPPCLPWHARCRQPKLCYIGFSQGTAQAFAAFSSNSDLLEKVQLFVALSPAVRANHLSKSLLLSLVQANLRCMKGKCWLVERLSLSCAVSAALLMRCYDFHMPGSGRCGVACGVRPCCPRCSGHGRARRCSMWRKTSAHIAVCMALQHTHTVLDPPPPLSFVPATHNRRQVHQPVVREETDAAGGPNVAEDDEPRVLRCHHRRSCVVPLLLESGPGQPGCVQCSDSVCCPLSRSLNDVARPYSHPPFQGARVTPVISVTPFSASPWRRAYSGGRYVPWCVSRFFTPDRIEKVA